MTDQDLEVIYKANVAESHAAGLRGVFDAGFNLALGQTQATSADASINAVAVTAQADTPVVTTV